MAVLHIVRNSAFNDNKLNLCLSVISSNDIVFLMDDGVYNIAHPKLLKRLNELTIYVLTEHLNARGLALDEDKIKQAD